MGPLVPDVITPELNLVVAFALGIAFGFILEQAGFSSSRKLTGLFYGTDFTVLRVFFTAGVTAMTGIVLLSHAGLLDTSVIYVHPTFVYSALLGGAVMGVGFVVGGYCPGTSFCGAAIGRVDGMVFVLGGLIGAFGFAEAYPHVQRVYLASSLGDLTVPAVLGIPSGLFALLMILMAVAAFVVTTRIERRVNPAAPAYTLRLRAHRLAAIALVCAGIAAAATPDYKNRLLARASREADRGTQPIARVSADELAFRLLDGDTSLVVVDVRPSSAFAASSLPGAVNIPAGDLFSSGSKDVMDRSGTRKIFVADDETQARTAASLALLLGYRNVGVLEDGLTGFTRSILAARKPSGAAGENDVAEFRAEAATRLTAMMAARRAPKPAPRTVKKIAGGCGV